MNILEIAFPLLRSSKDKVTELLNQAIKETNEQLKLNIELGISMDYGDSYADVH